jgi:peptide/nickel transport system permease protein
VRESLVLGFIAGRLLQGVPVLLGVTFITFALFHVFGGNPLVEFLGKAASPQEVAELARAHGLDQPLWQQYLHYLREIATWDFGRSWATREPVMQIFAAGAGPTLSFTVPALVATTLLALAIGLLGAAARGRWPDRGLMLLAVAGMSISFLVYIVAGQYLLAFRLPLFRIHGYEDGLVERWQYLALPICILIAAGLGYEARFYRAVLVEELDRDHVRTARAKGASTSRVLLVHVLRGALVPIVTRIMISLPFLLTGSLLLEAFFGVPGLGNVLLEALNRADLPVLKAYTVLMALLFWLSTLANDLLYGLLDPRIRLP